MSRRERPRTACIGAGRLAGALLPRAAEAGYPVVAVASRRLAAAGAVCRRVRGARPTSDPVDAAGEASLILLAVADRAIAPLARTLAGAAELEWTGRVVLHHAGALGPDALRPLARAGASVGVLHPLQTLGGSRLAASLLVGSHARIEGQPRARAAAARLARDVGLVPLPLDAELSRAERSAYHAAASMVSNDLLALLSHAVQLLESIGLGHRAALRALAHLARGTLCQAERQGIARTLTGPVVRGDAETVRAQLTALRRRSRSAAEVHCLLSEQLLRLAEQQGRPLPRAELRRLRLLLRAGRGGRRTV